MTGRYRCFLNKETEKGRTRLLVMISGRGSNMRAITSHLERGKTAAQLVAVISDRDDAPGLQYARIHSPATGVVAKSCYREKSAFNEALGDAVASYEPDLIALAGFMSILNAEFLSRFSGRVLNIHPALLPDFKGLNTHQRVIEAGASEHGCTTHFVSEELDAGPCVLQERFSLHRKRNNLNSKVLAERVLALEHQIYPATIQLFCDGRLRMEAGKALVDGKVLHKPMPLSAIGKTVAA